MTGLIAFFKTPLGTGLLVALGLLIYVQVQRNDAAEGAASECRADFYRQQVEDLQKRLADAEKLQTTFREAAELAESEQRTMEMQRDKVVADLRATQNECGRFTADERKRVLNLKK